MLRELRVRNFAIIDDLAFSPGPGLSALTGETGAGKSILVEALGIALGERAYSEMIRTGAEEAVVEAYFDMPITATIEALGVSAGDGIIIRRSVSRTGKSRAYINNTMVTLQALADIGRGLVDMHGQHEHQSLLSVESQMALLDRYGKLEAERGNVSELYHEAAALRGRIERLRQGARERAQRLDLLKYQANEIASAAPAHGEDDSLKGERSILSNLTRLNELLEASYGKLYADDGSASERIASALDALRAMSEIDAEASGPLEVLTGALPLVEEASLSLRSFRDKYQMDPGRLTEVDDRLRVLENLKSKYGDSIDEVLAYMAKAESEAAELETSDETAGALEDELLNLQGRLEAAARTLTKKRAKAGAELEAAIKGVLRDLALEKAVFSISLSPCAVTETGGDALEFLFSANPGEPPKALKRVASGGELSRIMLAIKSVLRTEDDIPVLIFDEVDAGIGGKTAQNVALRLKALARERQVLCITHLPQIAARADFHYVIDKTSTKTKVSVSLRGLDGEERAREIARMLSGTITETSLKHARELIEG